MITKATPQEISEALGFVPADERDLWLRMGMAVKSALGADGFDLWNKWSQSSALYVEQDAKDVWKSIKDGPVTIASLFAEAKANGYEGNPAHNGHEAPKTPEALWNSGTESGAGNHGYMKSKGIGAHGVRVSGNTLLVPVRDFNGKLCGVQRIFKKAGKWEKLHAKGSELGDGFHAIGNLDSGTIIISESYGTGATIYEVTGHPVAISCGCERLGKVGAAIRAKYPKATILFAGDEDSHLANNPGRTKATKAAKEIHAGVVFPVFQTGTGGDFNDLMLAEGAEVVKSQIEAALRKSSSSRSVELIHGASITPKAINWLWDGWLARGKFHVLAGPPGTGKTTIAAALAATVTCGGRWPDGTRADAGNVLIWSGEDDPEDTLQGRLLACGADPSRFWYVGDVKQGDDAVAFDPAEHIDVLMDAASKIGNVSFLIVDPIVSAVAGDSHKNAEVRRGLQPLVTLASKLNCAVIGISHFTKGTAGRDPVERVTGSIAFGALARVVFAAAKMPEGDQDGGARLFCRSKSNIGMDDGGFRYDLDIIDLDDYPGVQASRLLWGKAEVGSARELLNRAEAQKPDDDDDGDHEAPEVDTWLKDFLSGGPKTAKEVFAAGRDDGYSKDQLKHAKKRLGVRSEKDRFNGPWAWAMPEGSYNEESDELPNKKTVRPSRSSLEATNGAGSSDYTIHDSGDTLRPSSEASNGAGSSDFETRRERRERDFQSVGKNAPFAPLVDPFTGDVLDPDNREDF